MKRHDQPSRGSARCGRRGFSIIELLVVVIISTIGFVGLLGLQTATLRGLANTRQMVQATTLAENFLEMLRLEFMAWQVDGTSLLGDSATFPHLVDLPVGNVAGQLGAYGVPVSTKAGATSGWEILGDATQDDRRVSVVGAPHPLSFNDGIREATIDPGFEDSQKPFCALYRLTWLIPDRAIRAEVEVSWPLENANMTNFIRCEELAAMHLGETRSVTLTTTLVPNLFQR
jgi:prepilin-type N-terminal cleavage/methylation domain-containing protein